MKQKLIVIILFAMTHCFCLTVKAGVRPIEPKTDFEVNSKDLDRYLNPVFENVDIQKDILFGEVTNIEGVREKLLLDVYTPAGDKKNSRPAILWIHGGGFKKGINDKAQRYIVGMANAFARRGYVCISINYRVRDNPRDDITGTMSHALEDAMSGLQWVRANSKKYNIDKNKIIVGGGSAGGMIAVNLCYKDDSDTEKWDKSGIIGLVNLWGSPDESLRMSTVDQNDPPTIIVHGTEDKSVPFANTERLAEELKTAGVKYEVVPISGAGHTPASHMDEFNKNVAQFLYDILFEK
ncbi:MAG: alpha/beta hydrolase [Cyclobacteriaceae bacterium]|nr:alpha/beta hydrolase [Cyclobacteriaceae bacterium]